jgi:DNA (cytosine-5)-methyltransferase 1
MTEKGAYTVGSLYAGVEGIGLGFEQAGFKLRWANEIDAKACQTIRANFNHSIYEIKIEEIEPSRLEPVDVITAGFPCQGFSIAGYQKGFEDYRGHHFFEVIKVVKHLRPKVLFLENVKNLVSHDSGKTFRIICDTLDSVGYVYKHAVLNSCEYGNVPQNRERIYVVAFRSGDDAARFRFPESVPLSVSVSDMLEAGVDRKFFYDEKSYNWDKLKEGVTKKDTVYQWRRVYVRENKNNVCPTLTANMGTGGHNVPIVLTEDGIRKLTPKECFRLQGFPDGFTLPEIGRSHLYKQAGNSVTVPVIRRIAGNIMESLCAPITTADEEDNGSVAV